MAFINFSLYFTGRYFIACLSQKYLLGSGISVNFIFATWVLWFFIKLLPDTCFLSFFDLLFSCSRILHAANAPCGRDGILLESKIEIKKKTELIMESNRLFDAGKMLRRTKFAIITNNPIWMRQQYELLSSAMDKLRANQGVSIDSANFTFTFNLRFYNTLATFCFSTWFINFSTPDLWKSF